MTTLPDGREIPTTHAEMQAAKIPLQLRDACVTLLLPLNECRQATGYKPWKCTDERHAYEKCEYEEYLRRMEVAKQAKASH